MPDHDREAAVPAPNGCRWCGLDARDHYRRWKEPVGWHKWTSPTDAQRKERMLARKQAPNAHERAGISAS
jgi:hypothetical protein